MSFAQLSAQVQSLAEDQKGLAKVVTDNQEWVVERFLEQERSAAVG